MKTMTRQGDVLLLPVPDEMPITPRAERIGKLSRQGRLVLAEGETSAHEHTLASEDAELVRQGERMLLSIFRDTPLVVTDSRTGDALKRHDQLTIHHGLYEVRTQRELEVGVAGQTWGFRRVRD